MCQVRQETGGVRWAKCYLSFRNWQKHSVELAIEINGLLDLLCILLYIISVTLWGSCNHWIQNDLTNSKEDNSSREDYCSSAGQEIPLFMEIKDSIQCSQKPATLSYRQPLQQSQRLKYLFLYLLVSKSGTPKWWLSFKSIPSICNIFLMSTLRVIRPAHLFPPDLSLLRVFGKAGTYKAPHCAHFSILLLFKYNFTSTSLF
jgi:hypothetical protein